MGGRSWVEDGSGEEDEPEGVERADVEGHEEVSEEREEDVFSEDATEGETLRVSP